MGTGQILINGTETFVPIMTRLWEIVKELIPYVIYIGIGAASINLVRAAVKFILAYLKKKNMTAFYTYEDNVVRNKDGETFKIVRHRKPRKKIKWKYIKRFR